MVQGRRLALDFGLTRIGAAVSDPEGKFAFPTSVLDADSWESQLPELLREYEPSVVYIGFPLNLSGDAGSSARLAREFAIEVAGLTHAEVRLVDERLTTKSAIEAMRANGKSEREGRSEVDAVAAALLLESVLRYEQNSGFYAGSNI